MISTEISLNAEKISETINKNSELTFNELLKLTKLSEQQLLISIGWLAKENKIIQINPYQKDWKICKYNLLKGFKFGIE
jgi:hypothetical protein